MRVRDVMSSPAVATKPDARIKDVAGQLANAGFTSMPVVAGGELVGMVSEADLLAERFPPDPRLPRSGGWHPDVGDTVADVMQTDVPTASPHQPISEILGKLRDAHLRSAPVVERGVVVGVVTYNDLLRALARDDELIARDVRRRVSIYARPDRWRVDVVDGEVTLTGDDRDPAERSVIERIAESVIGVTAVRFATPMSMEPQR